MREGRIGAVVRAVALLTLALALYLWLRGLELPRNTGQGDAPAASTSVSDELLPSSRPVPVDIDAAGTREIAESVFDSDAQARRHVHVIVVSPSGAPVAGARVTLETLQRPAGQGLTDPEGVCSVEVSPFAELPLMVRASQGGAESSDVPAVPEEDVTLVLRPLRTYRFKVLDDETGEPIEGCLIDAFDPSQWTHHSVSHVQRRTSAQGTCSLSMPAPAGRFMITHPFYRSRAFQDSSGPADPLSEFIVRLSPRPTVRVRVTDSNRQPIPRPEFVRWMSPLQSEPILPRTVMVEGRVEHHVPATEDLEMIEVRAGGFEAVQFQQAEAGSVVEIELHPGAELTGRFVGLAELGEVRLRLFSRGNERPWKLRPLSARADPTGRFRVRWLSRQMDYRVIIESPEIETVERRLRVEAGDSRIDWGDVNLRQDGPALSIVVTDPAGRAVPRARITWGPNEESWFTDASGRATVPRARPGRSVCIYRTGFLETERSTDEHLELAVELRPAPLVRGVVVDDRGAPIPFAEVRLLPAEDRESSTFNQPHTWCDARGRFELSQAHPGRNYLHAEAPGFTLVWPFPQLGPGENVVVKLERNAWLEVELIGGDLREEWSVETRYFGEQRKRVPRNERVVLVPIESGDVDYTVVLPDRPPIHGRVQVFPGETGRVQVSAD